MQCDGGGHLGKVVISISAHWASICGKYEYMHGGQSDIYPRISVCIYKDMNVCMVAGGQFSIHPRISWMYSVPLVPPVVKDNFTFLIVNFFITLLPILIVNPVSRIQSC